MGPSEEKARVGGKNLEDDPAMVLLWLGKRLGTIAVVLVIMRGWIGVEEATFRAMDPRALFSRQFICNS